MNIFTYGTLMIPEVMVAVTTRKFRSIDAILKGYARFKVKDESYPGIIPASDAVTQGILYFDVDELSLERLDEFEGDLYQRTSVRVETKKEETLSAETYVIKPELRSCLSLQEWTLKEFAQKHLAAFLETYKGFQ
jgi:gamma-glutamylcyclotransferase (GGCT)/AIG2-like uncharacterized protein YtfP